MKKRILSMLLAPMLLFSAAVPGMAAEGGDSAERLAAVTGKVKDILGLDTGRYQDFSGRLTEGELAPVWRLSWSGEEGSLEVTATEAGKVISYYFYSDGEQEATRPLSLPKLDPARARAAAAAFLGRVLDAEETVDLDAAGEESNSLWQTRYYFRGSVLLNGCPSPLRFSLSVRTSDYAVVQFWRDALETDYIGALPDANFRMSQSAAEPLLRDTLSLRLEYVLDEGGKTAVLRYLPNGIDRFYVDDASGQLINLTRLYEELGEGGDYSGSKGEAAEAPAAAADFDRNGGLTQAEQLGADKLKGALSKETLNQKARMIAQLGLDSYTLASVSYQEEEFVKGEPVIAARLSYARRAEEETFRRIVTMNAKTGALIGVYSSRPWSREETGTIGEDAARKTAEAFLAAQQGERFALCGDYAGDPAYDRENGRYGTWSFRYARKENGYFFPEHQFAVEIDALDGCVSSYSQFWAEDVHFDSPEGLISGEQAVNAYFDTFQVVGGYTAVPQKLDLSDPEYAPLAKLGYRALNSLKLGWQLAEPEKAVEGIDAKSGQPILRTGGKSGPLQYSDLIGSPAKHAAETLAAYGIGYAGGVLRPQQKLTQLDLAVLLASTQGISLDPDNLAEGDADQVYRTAYSMGMLRREERNDGKLLSKIDVIKYLLDAGGYGPAARLQGIYRTDFSDESDIQEDLLGYAALAQALNVVRKDDAGQMNPGQAATRADAVVMLFEFMSRG